MPQTSSKALHNLEQVKAADNGYWLMLTASSPDNSINKIKLNVSMAINYFNNSKV